MEYFNDRTAAQQPILTIVVANESPTVEGLQVESDELKEGEECHETDRFFD